MSTSAGTVSVLTSATYQREPLASCLAAGAAELLEHHYYEIAHYQDIPLDIDWPQYEKAEAAGLLWIFTARVAGALVGYSAHFVAYSLKYKSSLQAIQDVLFVHPDYRRGFVGFRLIRFADQQLKVGGAQVSYHHSKIEHPALGKILDRMGYERVDILHARRLDR